MRTYNVALHKGVDYDEFWNEIENASDTDGFVPSRRVNVVWERESSLRQCWYELSDEEADLLRQDPRVCCVEIPPEHRDDIEIGLDAITENQLWRKGAPTSANDYKEVNWGLLRTNSTSNPFSTSTSGTANFPFSLDGTGVDVVIQDSGVQIDHPEFLDANGESRVQQINWFTESGVSGTMPAFSAFYNDTNGHGTHVAGIACGRNYGRAKNARMFVQTVNGLNGAGTTGITPSQCFDTLKGWHLNKPVDPSIGYKRPTIVNMSWGYGRYFATNITGGEYQGAAWTQASGGKDQSKGMIGAWYGGTSYRFGSRVSSVDIDLEECLDAGIIFCKSAGNYYQTVDVEGGTNFDNYYYTATSSTPVYYMQGGSPWSNDAIIVGNAYDFVSSTSYSGLERKSSSSESGPAVTIWAPGTDIISACSQVNEFSAYEYPYGWDTDWACMAISGTSMSSPQVTGYCALIAQVYPFLTPAQMKQYIIDNSTPDVLYDVPGTPESYSNNTILHGAPNRYLYQPFQASQNGSIEGPITGSNLNVDFGESFADGSDTPAPAPTPAPSSPPTINSFTSSNYSLGGTGSVTLSWNISNATSATITNVGSVNPAGGSTGTTVSTTTTFTLTATNSDGSVTSSLTVTVGSTPVINYFTASPSSTPYGGYPVNLSWSVSNAVSASISNVGSVNPAGGSTTVAPYSTTTYVLTVYSSGGQSTTRGVTVYVSGIPFSEDDNP